jgi:hypothetical protein
MSLKHGWKVTSRTEDGSAIVTGELEWFNNVRRQGHDTSYLVRSKVKIEMTLSEAPSGTLAQWTFEPQSTGQNMIAIAPNDPDIEEVIDESNYRIVEALGLLPVNSTPSGV